MFQGLGREARSYAACGEIPRATVLHWIKGGQVAQDFLKLFYSALDSLQI